MRKMKSKQTILLLLLIGVVLVSGCVQSEPAATSDDAVEQGMDAGDVEDSDELVESIEAIAEVTSDPETLSTETTIETSDALGSGLEDLEAF